MNKKAVELNVTTIIVVILGILVLVVLALYFTGGMKTLWQKITPVAGAYEQTDLEQARSACTLYCSINDQTSFCTHEFTIRTKNAKGEYTGSETKYCDDARINAVREQECKAVGFDKINCNDIRSPE